MGLILVWFLFWVVIFVEVLFRRVITVISLIRIGLLIFFIVLLLSIITLMLWVPDRPHNFFFWVLLFIFELFPCPSLTLIILMILFFILIDSFATVSTLKHSRFVHMVEVHLIQSKILINQPILMIRCKWYFNFIYLQYKINVFIKSHKMSMTQSFNDKISFINAFVCIFVRNNQNLLYPILNPNVKVVLL